MESAIHNTLRNDDILVEIFGHLSLVALPAAVDDCAYPAGGEWLDEVKIRRKTLARLALTCRAFAETASNELWASPPEGLYALLKLFSAFVAREEMIPRCGVTYYLRGDICALEWASFVRCAARVREISYYTARDSLVPYIIDPTVFTQIYVRSKGLRLFPRLQSLTWGESLDKPGNLHLLRMLAVPSVTRFATGVHPARRRIQGLLRWSTRPLEDVAIVAKACPRLRHVATDLPPYLEETLPLAACSSLESLHTARAYLMFLRRLAHMSKLRYLHAGEVMLWDPEVDGKLKTDVVAVTSLSHSSRWNFSNLRKIVVGRLEYAPVAEMDDFLLAIGSSPMLKSACIHFEAGTVEHAAQAVAILSTGGLADSLRELELDLRVRKFGSLNSERVVIPFMDLAGTLLRLVRLETLKLSFRLNKRQVSITEDDLVQMAHAWPRLASLYISSEPGASWKPYVTQPLRPSLGAVAAFAAARPQLTSLGLSVSDVSDADISSLAHHVPHNPALSQLVLLDYSASLSGAEPLRLPDVQRLAEMLLRLFPNLEGDGVLEPHERRGPHMDSWWSSLPAESRVRELGVKLDVLQAARRRASRHPSSKY